MDRVEFLPPLRLPQSGAIEATYADVLILRSRYIATADVPRILEYVEQGGGLLVADMPKNWLFETSDDLRIHGANQLLAHAGIIVTPLFAVEPFDHMYRLGNVDLARSSTSEALRHTIAEVLAGKPPDTHRTQILNSVLHSTHPSNPLLRALDLLRDSKLPALTELTYPLSIDNSIGRFAALIHHLNEVRLGFRRVDIESYSPLEADISITLCTSIRGWHFTGVYVEPGKTLHIWTAGGGDCDDALTFRIGHALDGNVIESAQTVADNKGWRRYPYPSRVGLLPGDTPKDAALEVTTTHGGMLYVVVTRSSNHNPNRIEPHSQYIRLAIRGGTRAPKAQAPREIDEWKAMCQSPGTWGELYGHTFALCLPTEVLATASDPSKVVDFWDRIVNAFLDMFVPHTESHRIVRLTVDAQPSKQPSILHKMVILPFKYGPLLLDPDALQRDAETLKEIVHKIAAIYVSYDGQLTPAFSRGLSLLLAGYAMEMLERTPRSSAESSRKPSRENGGSQPTGRSTRDRERPASKLITDFSASTFSTSTWDEEQSLRFLKMLKRAFGWPIFRTAFALRSGLDRRLHVENKPTTPEERVVVLFCTAVQFNLCNQFTLWGFSIGPTARRLVHNLPRWNPMFAEHEPIPEAWFQVEARAKRRAALRDVVFANFLANEIEFNRRINKSLEIEPLNLHLLWDRPPLDQELEGLVHRGLRSDASLEIPLGAPAPTAAEDEAEAAGGEPAPAPADDEEVAEPAEVASPLSLPTDAVDAAASSC